MQKKIIAMAVAAAFVAPAAFADVSTYGKADMALAITDNGDTSTTQVSSQVTKLGFKGSEDLGNGLATVWQIEQQIDIDAAGSGKSTHTTFAGRNSFAGLKGDFGTVLLGRHDTPYKIATRGMDVFGDQLADNRSLMGGAGGGAHDARLGDLIAYISPAMSGVTVAAAYVAGAEAAFASGSKKGSAYSLAALYGDGPINASIAYQSIKYGDAGTGTMAAAGGLSPDDKFDAFKLGGSYTMDMLKLNAVYEKTNSSGSGIGDALDQTNYYLSGVYDLGGDDVKLAYTKAGDMNSMSGTGASQVSVGYDHSLSKNTSLYAQYTSISNDSAATYGITTAGSTAGISAAAAGKDPSAWAFGLKTSF